MNIKVLYPVFLLVILLFYNIFFEEGLWLGDYTNQYLLLGSALFAVVLGFEKNFRFKGLFQKIYQNLKTVGVAIVILLFVGALTGTWLISGVVPAMVYYGLQILNPDIFLPACVIIAILVSLATGSSWTTSATVGIALIGVGTALGIPTEMAAGAIISGAYFGDKISPLSDTTNLAPAIAGTDLYTHIRYMLFTTLPSIFITLVLFTILGLNLKTSGQADLTEILENIQKIFVIKPFLFVVPALVIVMILMKIKPLIALSSGVVLGGVFAGIFQKELLEHLGANHFKTILESVFFETNIKSDNEILERLFSAKGMMGMLWTIFLIISAMIFGGAMEYTGFLPEITKGLLKLARNTFQLFLSTVLSCLGLNIITSEQYLSIVIPGKMFKDAYKNKKLAPENLSRSLEDSATVTSVLVPWNTCGAYQSSVLGVDTVAYVFYCFFNLMSPLMTLFFAALKIKIKKL